MTIKELAQNWMENDRSGDWYNREMTEEDAERFIGYMDPETLEELDEVITPEAFAEAWNDLIKGI